MLVMAISDVLTMNFFWLVRDEGSWLDIGTSITNFVIASLLCVFVAGLELISEIFISGVEVGGNAGDKKGWELNGIKRGREGDERANGHSSHASNGNLRGEKNHTPQLI